MCLRFNTFFNILKFLRVDLDERPQTAPPPLMPFSPIDNTANRLTNLVERFSRDEGRKI
jgi:hypothetical protein